MKRSRTPFGFWAIPVSILFLLAPTAVLGLEKESAPVAGELPHYFPDGIETINSSGQEWQQWEAYLRYLSVTDLCADAEDRIPMSFERSIRVETEIAGKKTTIVFDPWIRVGDKIVFYDFCGQHYASEDDFGLVVSDFVKQFSWAIDEVYDYHKDLEADVIRLKAERQSISVGEMKKQIDIPLPELPSATFRDLEQVPRSMTKADFVPREVHFGYGPKYLGATWLNSGVVYITLQARITDQLIGKPRVMIHEYIHCNTVLQSFPLSEGVDVEFLASVPQMLLPEDKISLPFHGYLRDLREMIWVFFGYNFDQAQKEIVVFNHDGHNLRIDPRKFNEYLGKLEEVKKELTHFFRTKALPEFYSDPVFWTSLHEKLQDKCGIFRIMMALNYDLTILDGRDKTKAWLELTKEERMEMAQRAFEESGRPSQEREDDSADSDSRIISLTFLELVRQTTGIDEKELMRLAKKYHLTERDLRGKSFSELMRLFRVIMTAEKSNKGGEQ